MSKFDELIEQIKIEIDGIRDARESVDAKILENQRIEEGLKDQYASIKESTQRLTTYQQETQAKDKELTKRETQIVIREKSIIQSNKLLDEKLQEFRQQTVDFDLQKKQLAKDTLEYKAKKAVVDRQAEIYKKLEETEDQRRRRMKTREEELDQELARLRGL